MHIDVHTYIKYVAQHKHLDATEPCRVQNLSEVAFELIQGRKWLVGRVGNCMALVSYIGIGRNISQISLNCRKSLFSIGFDQIIEVLPVHYYS